MNNELKIIKRDDQKVKDLLKNGEVDFIDTISVTPSDEILLFSIESGVLEEISNLFPEKRSDNKEIPMKVILAASIACKLNMYHSIDNVPYLLQDATVLSKLGYNFVEIKDGISEKGYKENQIFVGDTIRKLLFRHFIKRDSDGNRIESKKDGEELIKWYNTLAKTYYKELKYEPTIHILDCTKLDIDSKNTNYENANWTSQEEGNPQYGYKLSTLRSVLDNAGVIEEIALGGIKENDLKLSSFVLESDYLKHSDILIEDRGFIDGETISKLKLEKGVDVYVPAKKGMTIYKEAIKLAEVQDNWTSHPTRKQQEICLVRNLEIFWDTIAEGIKICGAVVKEVNKKTGEIDYYVFLTTQNVKYAKTIIKNYQIRPEIEEDFRHLKPVWGLRNFTSTKYVNIIFHIIMTLTAYNLFKVFTNTKKGENIGNKTLKRIELERRREKISRVIVYSGDYFAFITTKELVLTLINVKADKRQRLEEKISEIL